MAGSPRVRRVVLVNALIFAVLAAAVALAYYGYSYTSEVASPERELQLLQDLADEKVLNIESLIEDDDNRILTKVQIEPTISDLRELVKTTSGVSSVFVLDDQLKLVPDGSVSLRTGKLGIEFRDKFLARMLPELPLKKQTIKPGTGASARGHVYKRWDGRPYLFSFVKKVSGWNSRARSFSRRRRPPGRVRVPQFFTITNSPRLYQVVDETGYSLRPAVRRAGSHVVEVPFVDTVDHWILRVSQKDMTDPSAIALGVINSPLAGGA
jgi:hypothetical protein